MTFWDFASNAFTWLESRFTRILGVASGTIATLTASGIIPDKQLKYWVAGIAVLTFWRGQATSNTYNDAKAVLASAPTLPAMPAQSQVKP